MRPGINPVNWFEIYVNDMKRARKFYSTVLACEMTDLPAPKEYEGEMVSFPMVKDAPGVSGALVKMKGMEGGAEANSTVVYFTCADCAVEEGRVVAAGGKVYKSKFAIGEYGFCSWCIDTEGNCFGLHSMK